ncbi:MAG: gliding motility-associated C-terminal domain-containing protein, partial [Bacteroidetes bacterium]|nr:gliding motility-associated C-terminal domain-containing protein [Fibrella sp.]
IASVSPVSFVTTSCGNRTASVAITPAQTSRYDGFSINWGDGSTEVRTRAEVQAGLITHTYAGRLTSFEITVQGIYTNGSCPGVENKRSVTIANSTPPAVTALTTNADGTISIDYQGTGNLVLLLQKDATGTYQPTSQSSTNGSLTVTTDTRQVQCFKLATISTCGGATAQESDEVCSLVLDVQAIPQQNTALWQPYAGVTTGRFTQYQLTRNTTNVFTEPNRGRTGYLDRTNIQCGIQYCYTLTATLQTQAPVPLIITSAPVCVTGINATSPANSPKPAVTALRTNTDGTITINYQSADPVEVQQKDAGGVYRPISTTGTGSSVAIRTDTKQVQCFKLVTKNACGTAQESEEVCSLVLDAKAISKQNDLSWQPYAGTAPTFVRYRIYRNGAPSASINTKGTTTYSDNDNIECGELYCYYLEATVRGTTETTITSASACVTGINSNAPDALQNLFVTIEDGAVRVQGTAPTTSNVTQFTVTVSRADGSSGSFQPIGTVENGLLFIDKTVNTNQQSYCYQMTYQSSCGVVSLPSSPACTVWLTARTPTGIDWSSDSPFAPGAVDTYILETLDTEDNTTKFLDLGDNTRFDPDLNDPNVQRYRYRIVAYDANGTPSYSNFYEFRQEAKLYVQNAFTPNGDGANDTFLIKGVFVDQFDLTIYNRWGVAVFHTTDPTMAWDGTAGGQPASAGDYAYRLEIGDLTGKRIVKSGPILLIR